MDNPPNEPTRGYLVSKEPEERHRAEEALRRSEQRYRALVEAISQAVGSWSPPVGTADFSQLHGWWEKLTGQTIAEQQASTTAWLEFVHPEDREAVVAAWDTAITSGIKCDVEYRVRARAGGWRYVHARGVPIRGADGTIQEWISTLDDVTERRMAEVQLRQSEARLRRLASGGIIGVIRWDLDRSLILEANDEFLRMTGYDRADLASGRLNFRAMTPPEWTPRNEVGIRALRETGVGGAYEKEYFRKDGSRVPVIIVGVRFEESASEGMSFVLDITDRKLAEEALRESDRKKDEFLALLAHELRNPLAPLRNGLQVMRLGRGNPNATVQAQAMMERQLAHMVRLIDDLLDVSRINRNKMELRRERVALSDVVSCAVETARPVIEEAGHELTISLPQRPVFLDADLTRLAQVFCNLLTNSSKYTERGGHIWLSAERCEPGVMVSVRDTGIGIPAGSLATIFDMFSQVDRSLERSTGGLGIGLALVKGLVEMHGGTVRAHSEGQGKGSTFTVALPVLARHADEPHVATTENGEHSAGPKRNILVVDDNRDGADSLAMMLQLMNNDVQTANDGVQAVEIAERFRPDIILMDVGMPRLNGLDATRRIRQQQWSQGMRIIALTGWGQEADKEKSRQAGCDGHLVKPVNVQELEKLLKEMDGYGRA